MLSLEEKKAELEETVRGLQEQLQERQHGTLNSFPSPPVSAPSQRRPEQDETIDDFAEQISKLLVDPSGHARSSGKWT